MSAAHRDSDTERGGVASVSVPTRETFLVRAAVPTTDDNIERPHES